MLFRSAGVILVTKEQSYLIIDSRYFDKAKQRVTDCRVILLEDMRTQLSELLLKHDIRKLMLESDYMTLSEFAAYKEQLHFVELDATSWLSDFIWGMRIIKTAEEVKLIVKAQRIAEKAFERLVDNIHRDMTEKQVAFAWSPIRTAAHWKRSTTILSANDGTPPICRSPATDTYSTARSGRQPERSISWTTVHGCTILIWAAGWFKIHYISCIIHIHSVEVIQLIALIIVEWIITIIVQVHF